MLFVSTSPYGGWLSLTLDGALGAYPIYLKTSNKNNITFHDFSKGSRSK